MANSGQFKPGQSGNPGGVRKKIPAWVARFRAGEPAALKLVLAMVCGKVKGATPRDRLKAAELLLAYSRGRPRLAVELTGAEGGPVQVSTGDLLARLEQLAAGPNVSTTERKK